MKLTLTVVALLLSMSTLAFADCGNKGTKFDPVYMDGCVGTGPTRPAPKFDPIYTDSAPASPEPTWLDHLRFVWLRYVRGLDVTLVGAQHWPSR